MMPGRWLPTVLIVALVARLAWLGACSSGRVLRLSESVEYRVIAVPGVVHLRLRQVAPPSHPVNVRLLAIEPAVPPSSALARKARQQLAAWLLNRTVTVQLDRRQLDDDGRLLAYVFRGDDCVNERLVQAGFCRAQPQPCDYPTMARRLRMAESTAAREPRNTPSPLALRE